MWDVDYVQFARLLDEINAVGLTEDQMEALATSMSLEPKEVKQLFNRASARWDDLKPLVGKKTPLTEDQVAEELAENGKVEALVTVDFSEIIGQLEETALEAVIDDIAERATGDVSLTIDHKVLFADNDILYLKVIAKATDEDEDDDDGDDDDEDEVEDDEDDVEPV